MSFFHEKEMKNLEDALMPQTSKKKPIANFSSEKVQIMNGHCVCEQKYRNLGPNYK